MTLEYDYLFNKWDNPEYLKKAKDHDNQDNPNR